MRWLLRVCVILVAVGVIVIGGLLLLPGEHLARLAADQVKAQTGRDLTVDGDVRLSFWPVLGVETGPVSFANAEWAGDAPMLTASGLSIGVAAPDLLRGEIRIKRIDASDPVLRLESRGGKSNWTFDAAVTDATTTSTTPEQASSSTGAGQGDTLPPLVLEQLRLRNARMVLVQDGTVSLDQAGVDVTARWPGPDRPVEADLTVPLSADPIQVQISLGNLAGFVDGEVSAVTAKVKTAGGVLSFDGKANSSGDASGALLLEASNSRQFMASLGQPGIDLPHGLGRALKLDGQVTYTADGRVSIRQLQLVADGNSLSGDVDVTMSDKPKFTAHLNAQTLDLSALSEAASDPVSPSPGSSASADAEAGWSTAAIDASALGLADGTLSLSAASVILPQTTLGKTRIGLTIDRSRAVLRMEPVSIFGGTLTGQLVANNRNGLSVGGNLKASGIELNSALPALAEIDTLHGPVSGNLEFLGVGQSEDQIMRSLSGKGNVD
ncbi:MAG: AsmA family protein, partial [Pseudomonadota bacterium]